MNTQIRETILSKSAKAFLADHNIEYINDLLYNEEFQKKLDSSELNIQKEIREFIKCINNSLMNEYKRVYSEADGYYGFNSKHYDTISRITIKADVFNNFELSRIGKETMTYILRDASGFCKIGKSINPQKRFNSFKTGNPTIEVVYLIDLNIEKKLHDFFVDKRIDGEWYQLDNLCFEKIDKFLNDIDCFYIKNGDIHESIRKDYRNNNYSQEILEQAKHPIEVFMLLEEYNKYKKTIIRRCVRENILTIEDLFNRLKNGKISNLFSKALREAIIESMKVIYEDDYKKCF